MNHEENIILYAANQLDENERLDFEKHIAGCEDCQADLKLWALVADEITASDSLVVAPAHLAESTLEMIHQPPALTRAFHKTINLLRAQFLLIQNELWIGSAMLMLMFTTMALLINQVEIMYVFVPMLAAGSVSLIYGREHDTALELTLATPTSAWKILLARLTLVSAYNFLLMFCAGFILLLIAPPQLIVEAVLGWAAPILFLSALALLLSLWVGSSNAIFISYSLWLAQYASLLTFHQWFTSLLPWLNEYKRFWQNPTLLFQIAFVLIVVALWSASRLKVSLPQSAVS